jgi:hypothetical protein
MGAFRSGTCQLLALVAVGGAALIYPDVGRAYTAEQQQACTGDAFRFCSSDIPDVDRVTVCMIRNKAQLSPGCRVFFRQGPEPRRDGARAAGKPSSVKPGSTAASNAKSRKPKKQVRATAM